MNIWIRLIATFLKCLFRSKIKANDAISDHYMVGLTEADIRYMSNARYLLFMEVARFEMMLRTQIFKVANKNKWIPLVVSQTIRYKRPIKQFQTFRLQSQIVGWNEKWFFIEHQFYRHGKLAAFAMVKGCFRGSEGVIPPSKALAQVGSTDPSQQLPTHFLDWEKAELAQELSLQNEWI